MDIAERLKVLEDGFATEGVELKRILLDIRVFLMETNSPLRSDSGLERASRKVHKVQLEKGAK